MVKGERWQGALALLGEEWDAELEFGVISYDAWISACAKGTQWQQALALLSGVWDAEPEPDGSGSCARVSAGERASSGSELLGAARRDLEDAEFEPDVISYSAGISAFENGEQGLQAFGAAR